MSTPMQPAREPDARLLRLLEEGDPGPWPAPPRETPGPEGSFLADRTVLVTGGGGCVGAELCRRMALCRPRRIVALDICENGVYDLQQELLHRWGGAVDLRVEIASVRDRAAMHRVMERWRPQVVVHAAAHKHVPLMEACPRQAVENNVFGTLHVVEAAQACGVEKLLFISTDKAVQPASVMGASKRLGEMLLQARQGRGDTCLSAVRFGNVLGSSGSVVPLMRRQVAAGGPVTVTDFRATRYFMTVGEAARLVLQAGSLARGSELFVLDMGRPVRILDLARALICQSGHIPGGDIELVETGLRPGERLHEPSLLEGRDVVPTALEGIYVERQAPVAPEEMAEKLAALRRALDREDDGAMRRVLHQVVPSFREPVNPPAGD